jgi:hypothetical protein
MYGSSRKRDHANTPKAGQPSILLQVPFAERLNPAENGPSKLAFAGQRKPAQLSFLFAGFCRKTVEQFSETCLDRFQT